MTKTKTWIIDKLGAIPPELLELANGTYDVSPIRDQLLAQLYTMQVDEISAITQVTPDQITERFEAAGLSPPYTQAMVDALFRLEMRPLVIIANKLPVAGQRFLLTLPDLRDIVQHVLDDVKKACDLYKGIEINDDAWSNIVKTIIDNIGTMPPKQE